MNKENLEQRIAQYKELWYENHIDIIENYLRSIQRVTKVLGELSKPDVDHAFIQKLIPIEMADLRAHESLMTISLSFRERIL